MMLDLYHVIPNVYLNHMLFHSKFLFSTNVTLYIFHYSHCY